MRSFVTALLVTVLGGAVGYWRAGAEWNQRGDKIGDDTVAPEVQTGLERILAFPNQVDLRAGSVSPDAIPKVSVIGGTLFNFGTMLAGTERSHAFRIRNDGKATLKLEVLRSTCKCTIGTLKKNTLEPDEETTVELTWKAEGVLQDFSQTATIGTNDPRQLEVQLAIVGKLGRTYITIPEELSFGEFSAQDAFEKEFKLYSFEESPLIINAYWADLDQPAITVHHIVRKLEPNEIPEYAEARYVADFTVKVAPGLPAGPLNGQVHMEVGKDRIPLSVRCSGACVSNLRILAGSNYAQSLNSLQMGRIPSKDGGASKFHVAARKTGDEPIEMKLKEIVPAEVVPHLQVEIGEPIQKSQQTLFPVILKIPKDTPAMNYSGSGGENAVKLTFTTNLEGSNEIPINIRFIVEE